MKKIKFSAALIAVAMAFISLCCFVYPENCSYCFSGMKVPGNTRHRGLFIPYGERLTAYTLCAPKYSFESCFEGPCLTVFGQAYNFDYSDRSFCIKKNGRTFKLSVPENARIVIDGSFASFENLEGLSRRREFTVSAIFGGPELVSVQTYPVSVTASVGEIENVDGGMLLHLENPDSAINACVITDNTLVLDKAVPGANMTFILDGLEALEVINK